MSNKSNDNKPELSKKRASLLEMLEEVHREEIFLVNRLIDFQLDCMITPSVITMTILIDTDLPPESYNDLIQRFNYFPYFDANQKQIGVFKNFTY